MSPSARLVHGFGCGALLFLTVTCGSDAGKTCRGGKATELGDGEHLCYCAGGETCSQTCPSDMPGCSIVCADASSCSLTAPGTECGANFQGAQGNASAYCGEKATIDCNESLATCSAVVGAEALVNCTGALDCQIECEGSCEVQCPAHGVCRVACADPTQCSVVCDGPINYCSNASGSVQGCNITC